MDLSEPFVFWPDINIPVTTTRALCITNSKSSGVIRIDAVDLIVLVNACMYVVMKTWQELRAGQILSRNLELTRRKELDPRNPAEQVFAVYDSVYEARRGIGRMDGRYRAIEIPELARWRAETDQLLRASWTLRKGDPEGDAQFAWVANERVRRHASDRAKHKVRARERITKVATLLDRLGRRNPSSIALQCSAADRSLQARVQEVRGIGRRMDWRAVVLEHTIDQLRSECWEIRRAAQDALTAQDIFGQARTPKTLRMRANRMDEYAEFLRTLSVRTFDRVFSHVAEELEEAGTLLRDAAGRRDTSPLERVRALLNRIYRSMVLVDEHWRLEEILAVVSEHHHRREPLSLSQTSLFSEELASIHRTLTSVDRVTWEYLDAGFVTQVIPQVVGGALLSRADLLNANGPNLDALYEHLKSACEPL